MKPDFVLYAKRMLSTLKDADDAMARLKRVETGHLTVGMVGTAAYFVPHLLACFHEQHPGIDVRLQVSANREQLAALLHANEVDLAVMGRPPKELATRSETFAAHPLVFVCPPAHPLMRIGHPPVFALERYPFIVREPSSGTRNAMDGFLQDHQFKPRITIEISSNETIKQAVIAGLGISFLSLHSIGLEVRYGLLRLAVEGTPVMRSWNVVHLLSKLLSPAAEALCYYIPEHGESYLLAHDTPLLGGSDQAAKDSGNPG